MLNSELDFTMCFSQHLDWKWPYVELMMCFLMWSPERRWIMQMFCWTRLTVSCDWTTSGELAVAPAQSNFLLKRWRDLDSGQLLPVVVLTLRILCCCVSLLLILWHRTCSMSLFICGFHCYSCVADAVIASVKPFDFPSKFWNRVLVLVLDITLRNSVRETSGIAHFLFFLFSQ